MVNERFDIVIAGAGPVGGTLACALGSLELRVALVERREPAAWHPGDAYDPRVSAISPGAENLLRNLEVWPGVERRRLCPYRSMYVWDALGTGEIHFDCTELGESRLGHIVENAVLQAALIERLRGMDHVTWFCPAGVESFELDGGGLDLQLDTGRRLRTRLLVGADGPRSRVRTLADIAFIAREYSQRATVATVRTERAHRHTAWQRFLPTGPLAFLPLADQGSERYSSIVWSTNEADAKALLALSDEAFCARLANAFDHRLGAVESAGERVAFPLRGGQAEPYVKPRIALVGDAAHVIHPLAGQGVNLGLMDAAVLAQAISEANRDPGSLRVLRRYARARRGENAVMMRAMEGFNGLFAQTSLPLRWLRGAGMNLTDGASPLKHRLMRRAMQLDGDLPPLARL